MPRKAAASTTPRAQRSASKPAAAAKSPAPAVKKGAAASKKGAKKARVSFSEEHQEIQLSEQEEEEEEEDEQSAASGSDGGEDSDNDEDFVDDFDSQDDEDDEEDGMEDAFTALMQREIASMVARMDESGPMVSVLMLRSDGSREEIVADMSPKLDAVGNLLGGKATFIGELPGSDVVLIQRLDQQNGDLPDNQHKLPAPFNNFKVRGDILCVKMDNQSNPQNFTLAEFQKIAGEKTTASKGKKRKLEESSEPEKSEPQKRQKEEKPKKAQGTPAKKGKAAATVSTPSKKANAKSPASRKATPARVSRKSRG